MMRSQLAVEMKVLLKINKYLAIALPSLRISPLFLIRIATIALLYTVAISNFVIYIQSIGSGIGIFSGLFLTRTLFPEREEVRVLL
jgi:hypothetical protein